MIAIIGVVLQKIRLDFNRILQTELEQQQPKFIKDGLKEYKDIRIFAWSRFKIKHGGSLKCKRQNEMRLEDVKMLSKAADINIC